MMRSYRWIVVHFKGLMVAIKSLYESEVQSPISRANLPIPTLPELLTEIARSGSKRLQPESYTIPRALRKGPISDSYPSFCSGQKLFRYLFPFKNISWYKSSLFCLSYTKYSHENLLFSDILSKLRHSLWISIGWQIRDFKSNSHDLLFEISKFSRLVICCSVLMTKFDKLIFPM